MAITRTTLLSGPASATFAGHTFFAQDGILVTPALELDPVGSDAYGVLDATVRDPRGVTEADAGAGLVTIKFTPAAPFADLMALYPHLSGAPGKSLLGPADVPLVLVASNGVRLTFSAVAVLQMPDLMLTNRGPVAGAVTFVALGARAAAVTAANRLVTIDTASVPLPGRGTPQLADDFAITWGGAPWVNLRSRDGVRVRFALTASPVFSDANGLLDLTLEGLAVEARFTPEAPGGPAEADVIAALELQGATALPGRSLAASAETLTIAGEHLWVELPLAQPIGAELAFAAVPGRVGELRFVSERAFLGSGEPEELAGLSEGYEL